LSRVDLSVLPSMIARPARGFRAGLPNVYVTPYMLPWRTIWRNARVFRLGVSV
jgi:hypothetical protein